MIRHSRFVFLSIALLFVLIVSLARPMAVLADDSTPPPPATNDLATEPTAAPTEETPIEVVKEPSSTDTVVDTSLNPDSKSVIVPEILEVAPEGTQVVVLDENGAPLPLVSEDAAAIVTT